MKTCRLKTFIVILALFALGVIALPSSAAGTLMLYLSFDEASGSATFTDASGNSFDGACSGGSCPTAGVSGKVDGALQFDGTDDYVEVPYNAAFNPNGSFTVAAWVYLTGGSDYRAVVASRAGSPTRGYILYATADDRWQLWLGRNDSLWHMVGTEPVVYNTWTHVAGVYDSTTQTIRVYVNGQPAGSQSGAAFAPNIQYPLRVGLSATEATPPPYYYPFPGSIDEVRIYASALTQAEIQQLAAPDLYANDDAYIVRESATLTVPAPGVLENDVLVADRPLTTTLLTLPSQGDLAQALDGGFVYTPTQIGAYPFTYLAQSGTMTDTATVTLTVEPDFAPVAADDTYTTDEITLIAVPAPGVLSNDSDANGDTLTATLKTSPAQGTLVLELDGSFVYTPALGFPGEYIFQYEASDGTLTDTATVTLTVAANLAPGAQDDAYTAYQNIPLTVAAPGVLENDSDANGHALTATLLAAPTHGMVEVQFDGSFTYTPTTDYLGTDTFTYAVSDTVLTDTATVTLTVSPPPCQVEVTGDNTSDYLSADASAVQQAVDNAAPGALIRIAGTCVGVQNRNTWYSQTVYVDRSLTLQGGYSLDDWSWGPDPEAYPTTLDAQRLGRVVYISGSVTVTLDGLVMTRGFAEDDAGGGVYSTGTLTVTQSTFDDNESGQGGALYGGGATLSIAGSTFTGNHAYEGGGIYVWGESLTLSDTLFHTNTVDYNGGAIYSENNVLTLDSVTLRDNASDGGGGAIYATNTGDGKLFATRSTFQENHASDYGGAIYGFGIPMTLTQSSFYTNTIDYVYGGAIANAFAPVVLDDIVFSGNLAREESYGGAIYTEEGTLVANNASFRRNSAGFSGGAVYASYNPLTVTHSLFYTNTADYYDGGAICALDSDVSIAHSAFYSNTAVSEGGALWGRNSDVVLNDVLMERNTALKGGGVHLWIGTLDVTSGTFRLNHAESGGAIRVDYRPLTVTHSVFYTNTATSGAGGAIYGHYNPSVLLDTAVLRGNTANTSGGGLYVLEGTRLEVTDSTFQQNSSTLENGGGLYASANTPNVIVTKTSFFANTAGFYGGGMHHHASAVLSDLTFSGNSAIYGGGLVNDGSSYGVISPALTNVTFTSNTAFSRGGALYNDGSDWGSCTPTLTNVIFRNNTAYSGGALYFYGWDYGEVGGTVTNGLFDANGDDHVGYEAGEPTAQPHFVNCTFTGAISRTATVESFSAGQKPISFTNSIFWGNGGDLTNDDAAITVTHSIVEESGYPGTGNLYADPQFVDAAGGNLRVWAGSPAIDAGDDGAVPAGVTTDLDGFERFVWLSVDMGAYESQYEQICELSEGTHTLGQVQPITLTFATAEDLGELFCLNVTYFPASHPQATAPLQTGAFWTLGGTDGENSVTTGFTATLTLPYAGADATSRACRYPGGMGGAGWDCDDGSHTTFSAGVAVTRTQIHQFSDWTIGNGVDPTVVNLSGFGVRPAALWLPALGIALAGLVHVRRRARRVSDKQESKSKS